MNRATVIQGTSGEALQGFPRMTLGRGKRSYRAARQEPTFGCRAPITADQSHSREHNRCVELRVVGRKLIDLGAGEIGADRRAGEWDAGSVMLGHGDLHQVVELAGTQQRLSPYVGDPQLELWAGTMSSGSSPQ